MPTGESTFTAQTPSRELSLSRGSLLSGQQKPVRALWPESHQHQRHGSTAFHEKGPTRQAAPNLQAALRLQRCAQGFKAREHGACRLPCIFTCRGRKAAFMACNPYAAAPAGQATYAARSALGKRSAAYALPWRSACVLLGKQQETFPYESMTWHPVHCI